MQTVYIGNTLINDIFLGSKRMDDVIQDTTTSFPVEYLVVAGGGTGAKGGGGAGGLLSGSINLYTKKTYQVYVAPRVSSQNGNDSYFTGSFVYLYAYGGGMGSGGSNIKGIPGGSGGGGAYETSGNTTGSAAVAGQGNIGGNGIVGATFTGGGGGGAGSAGGNSKGTTSGGDGGNGKQSAIDGTLKYYAAGGVGYGSVTNGNPGAGGVPYTSSASDNSGTAISGPTTSGGPFAGSGYVVIRYLGSAKGTGGTIVQDGNYTIHKFSATGSSTLVLD